jgi:hypothetical protein
MADQTKINDGVFSTNLVLHADSIKREGFTENTNDSIRNSSSEQSAILPMPQTDLLGVPTWTIRDFMNERLLFRKKNLPSIDADVNQKMRDYDERGLYFYKLFFNFSTSYGLLGSLIGKQTEKGTSNSGGGGPKEHNTAYQYLSNNITSPRFSARYKNILTGKRESLVKFAKLLNYFCYECPWVFKEVTGIKTIMNTDFNEIVKEDNNKITITFNEDAIDMRISTLIDLYRDACYDYTNFKEIIPENLRKFDMSIILMNPPIDGFNTRNTSVFGKSPNGPEKSFNGSTAVNDLTSTMTFKCLILKNCEIALNDLSSTNDTFNNAEGFTFEATMNIVYDRAFMYSISKTLNAEILDSFYRGEAVPETEISPSANPEPENTAANTATNSQTAKPEENLESKTNKQKRKEGREARQAERPKNEKTDD